MKAGPVRAGPVRAGPVRVGPQLRGAAVWDPPADPAALAVVAGRLAAAGLPALPARPLGPLTTLGLGGPAALYLQPADRPALLRALASLVGIPADSVPLLVVGKGSNLLVSDRGFPGLAVRLGPEFKWIRRDGDRVLAGGGEAMPALAAWTARAGLAGLEFGAGIPATVGGCVRMNAGAHGGDTGARLAWAEVDTPEGSARLGPAELALGYRRSALPPRAVVTAAAWDLVPAEPERVRARLDELRAWRRATQPLRQRNCGSVFTNPPGDSAGRLIEVAGLKGRTVGGARVSDKHANFIVVDSGAHAADVYRLLADVQDTVAATGPLLTPEVRVIGPFPTG